MTRSYNKALVSGTLSVWSMNRTCGAFTTTVPFEIQAAASTTETLHHSTGLKTFHRCMNQNGESPASKHNRHKRYANIQHLRQSSIHRRLAIATINSRQRRRWNTTAASTAFSSGRRRLRAPPRLPRERMRPPAPASSAGTKTASGYSVESVENSGTTATFSIAAATPGSTALGTSSQSLRCTFSVTAA